MNPSSLSASTSAPRSINSLAICGLLSIAATCKGLRNRRSCDSIFDPAPKSSFTKSILYIVQPNAREVLPCLFCNSMSAPAASRSLILSILEDLVTQCSGVSPPESDMSGFAPYLRSWEIAKGSPRWQAQDNVVLPVTSFPSTSALPVEAKTISKVAPAIPR